MPGERLQTDLRRGGRVKAREFNAMSREVEILSRIRSGPGILISRDRTGISIRAQRQEQRGGGVGAALPVKAFVLQEGGVYSDSLRCRAKAEPGETVDILKEEKVRQSLVGKTLRIGGMDVTFDPAPDPRNQRITARNAVGVPIEAELWTVLPPWDWGDTIWALPIAEKDRVTLPSSASDDTELSEDGTPRTPASGEVTPEWIEVRGRWWAAERVFE